MISNEMMTNLNMLGLAMLNQILRDLDGTPTATPLSVWNLEIELGKRSEDYTTCQGNRFLG